MSKEVCKRCECSCPEDVMPVDSDGRNLAAGTSFLWCLRYTCAWGKRAAHKAIKNANDPKGLEYIYIDNAQHPCIRLGTIHKPTHVINYLINRWVTPIGDVIATGNSKDQLFFTGQNIYDWRRLRSL